MCVLWCVTFPPHMPKCNYLRACMCVWVTVEWCAPSTGTPFLVHWMWAAGLAPRVRQVRLCGLPAISRSSGIPSTTGSSGGTAGQTHKSILWLLTQGHWGLKNYSSSFSPTGQTNVGSSKLLLKKLTLQKVDYFFPSAKRHLLQSAEVLSSIFLRKF